VKTRKVVSLIRWSSAILILAALSLIANPPAGAAAGAACQGLKGTFLQLTEVQSARPAAEWRQLFDELRTIGINTLFLQWTVLDRKPLFPTARNETGANTPLGSILDLAAQSGIRADSSAVSAPWTTRASLSGTQGAVSASGRAFVVTIRMIVCSYVDPSSNGGTPASIS